MKHKDIILFLAFSPDGKYIASGSMDGDVIVWDSLNERKVVVLPHDNMVRTAAFCPCGRLLAVSKVFRREECIVEESIVEIWDWQNKNMVRSIHSPTCIESMEFCPDGHVLSIAGKNRIELWNLSQGYKTRVFPLRGHISSVSFSPDGRYLAAGGTNGVLIWDVTNGKNIAHFTLSPVPSVSFSPNGRYLAIASYDDFLRIFDIRRKKLVRRIKLYNANCVKWFKRESICSRGDAGISAWFATLRRRWVSYLSVSVRGGMAFTSSRKLLAIRE